MDKDTFAGNFEYSFFEGYIVLEIKREECPCGLAEDLNGLMSAHWLAIQMQEIFERACYGAPVYGPIGTFNGVVAKTMPSNWRITNDTAAGIPVWVPDGRNPVGKWFADAGECLLSLPAPEILNAVLRRHGIKGSSEPVPQINEIPGGWAVAVHRPQLRIAKIPGVKRNDSLLSLWFSNSEIGKLVTDANEKTVEPSDSNA